MVLCDGVHRDHSTGKWTILGTVSMLAAESYPAVTRLAVYWAITDVKGDIEITLRIVDSRYLMQDDAESVFELKLPLSSPSPLAVIEGAFSINTELKEPGVYHIELLHGQELLMSRRLVAVNPPSDRSEGES